MKLIQKYFNTGQLLLSREFAGKHHSQIKNLKTLNIIILNLAFLITLQAACRTKELNLAKDKTSTGSKQETQLDSRQSDSLTGHRMLHLTDSSRQFFRMTIFPLDTFTLSLQNGFKGRASSIELAGLKENIKMFYDSAAFTAEKQNTVRFDQQIKTSKTEQSSSKALRKSNLSWIPGLVVLALLAFIVLLGWKYKKAAKT